jgi:cysteinyl-tRNA synthetase
MYLLRGQFRNQMEYSEERLEETRSAYERMRRALMRLEELAADAELGAGVAEGITSETGVALEELAGQVRDRFREALCDDFNGEAAMAPLFELVREANPYLASRSARELEAAVVRQILAVLREAWGVFGLFGAVVAETTEVPPEIQEMVRRRDEARRSRDFALADTLRDEIVDRGFRLEDGPEGTKVRPA